MTAQACRNCGQPIYLSKLFVGPHRPVPVHLATSDVYCDPEYARQVLHTAPLPGYEESRRMIDSDPRLTQAEVVE